jgi:hypothetical protein
LLGQPSQALGPLPVRPADEPVPRRHFPRRRGASLSTNSNSTGRNPSSPLAILSGQSANPSAVCAGGACARRRPLRWSGGGNWIKPRACNFRGIVRAAISLSRPTPLRHCQRSARATDSCRRDHSGCSALMARISSRSASANWRPGTRIVLTPPSYAPPSPASSAENVQTPGATFCCTCNKRLHIRTWGKREFPRSDRAQRSQLEDQVKCQR